jgi:hypothetical protein
VFQNENSFQQVYQIEADLKTKSQAYNQLKGNLAGLERKATYVFYFLFLKIIILLLLLLLIIFFLNSHIHTYIHSFIQTVN